MKIDKITFWSYDFDEINLDEKARNTLRDEDVEEERFISLITPKLEGIKQDKTFKKIKSQFDKRNRVVAAVMVIVFLNNKMRKIALAIVLREPHRTCLQIEGIKFL